MAPPAPEHRRHVGLSGDDVAFGDRAVALGARHLCFEVRAVPPEHVVGRRIHAHPRNRPARRQRVTPASGSPGDRPPPTHDIPCTGCRRIGHQLARLRIDVAAPTLQSQRHVALVTVGNRLLRGRRRGTLLRGCAQRRHDDRESPENGDGTESMLEQSGRRVNAFESSARCAEYTRCAAGAGLMGIQRIIWRQLSRASGRSDSR